MQTMMFGNIEVYAFLDEFPDSRDRSKYQFLWRDAYKQVDTVVIHHWASQNYPDDVSQETEIAAMLGVRSMWMNPDPMHNTVGYPYHFTVWPSKRIYYNGSIYTNRACVAHENHHIICVALPGNFNAMVPSDDHIAATHDLNANIPLVMGKPMDFSGHGDMGQTSCPGHTWDQWMHRVIP